jgi:hypothetical protein
MTALVSRAKSSCGRAAAVEQAATWAKELTRREVRGPGDLENAWRRLEARYGVPAHTFWSLRYRKPKDILASIYFRLSGAYQAEVERQMRMLANELAITKAIAGPDHSVVRKIEALVDKKNSTTITGVKHGGHRSQSNQIVRRTNRTS